RAEELLSHLAACSLPLKIAHEGVVVLTEPVGAALVIRMRRIQRHIRRVGEHRVGLVANHDFGGIAEQSLLEAGLKCLDLGELELLTQLAPEDELTTEQLRQREA